MSQSGAVSSLLYHSSWSVWQGAWMSEAAMSDADSVALHEPVDEQPDPPPSIDSLALVVLRSGHALLPSCVRAILALP